MTGSLVSACYTEEADKTRQDELFLRLGLPVNAAARYLFGFREGRLSLWQNIRQAPAPTCVDFESADMQYRLRTSGRRQGLARAVGLHRRSGLRVLDATAGLGRDAFILAALGCRVTLLERSALMHALLEDGCRRASLSGSTVVRETVERLSLLHTDARQWLQAEAGADRRDVLYLDPMFPMRRKAAGVRKDIASLQQVLGPDSDADSLLQAALVSGVPRIVMKRPLHHRDENLPACEFQVKGKNSRFDVYVRSRESIAE